MTKNTYRELMRAAEGAGADSVYTSRAAARAMELCDAAYSGAENSGISDNSRRSRDIVLAAVYLRSATLGEAERILCAHEWERTKIDALLDILEYFIILDEDFGGESDNPQPFSTENDNSVEKLQEKLSEEGKITSDAFMLADMGAESELEYAARYENSDDYLDSISDSDRCDKMLTEYGKAEAKRLNTAQKRLRGIIAAERAGRKASLTRTLDTLITPEPIYRRLMLIGHDSGLKMDDYFVWCSSVVEVGGKYHMFASRWHRHLGFPQGYMVGSEIVHAVSDTPDGRYTFREVSVGVRPRGYWDSQMAHNPQVVKYKGKYIMFYLGASVAKREARAIGYAVASDINGKWLRAQRPIELGVSDCNNPSPYIEEDGSVLLAFRHGDQRIGIARADRYDAPYKVLSYDILPGISAEDPFLWRDGRLMRMIVEDGDGKLTGYVRHGAMLISEDCVHWRRDEYPRAYDHTLMFSDLSVIEAERRERPTLIFDRAGNPTHLCTGVLYNGDSWACVQGIAQSGK